MVNFELRSKHYLNMISNQQRILSNKISEVPKQVEDELFSNLFVTTFSEMTAQETDIDSECIIDIKGGRNFAQGGCQGSMQIYTSEFLKVVTEIMHRGKQYLNIQTILDMTSKMLFSGKLILVANTMPLYMLMQLHI